MDFDYERDTRRYYQNDFVARRYHRLFTISKGLKTFTFRFVARRELRTVESMLANVAHRTVLDVPAGTGKLANVLARLGSRVVACDISGNMLAIAKTEYQRIDYSNTEYVIADAAELGRFADASFDTIVCLRLMHRVPADVRQRMLQGFSRLASHVIVSYGIDNNYHKLRQRVRNLVTGSPASRKCFCSLASARQEVDRLFTIQKECWIAPGVSRELVFLLESKAAA